MQPGPCCRSWSSAAFTLQDRLAVAKEKEHRVEHHEGVEQECRSACGHP
jgi:hypothetical protein